MAAMSDAFRDLLDNPQEAAAMDDYEGMRQARAGVFHGTPSEAIDAKPESEPTGPITTAVRRIERALAALDIAVDTHHRRIRPILVAAPTRDEDTADIDSTSLLAATLHAQGDHIVRVTEELQAITERVDL